METRRCDCPAFSKSLLHPKYWPLWFGATLFKGLSMLPFPAILALGRGLGLLMYWLLKRRRHIAEVNVRLCFPEFSPAEQQQLVRKNMMEAGIGIVELVIAWYWSDKRLQKHCRWVGEENLLNAKKDGRGVVVLSCHFLSLEVGGRLFTTFYDGHAFYRPNSNPLVEWLQCRGRTRSKGHLVTRGDLRGALKVLRRGGLLWYAPDQDMGRKRSMFVPFFDVEDTATVPATATFAKAGNAHVMPFYQVRREDDSGYDLICLPELENFPTGDERQDTIIVNQVLEKMIRQHPDKYMWLHRRFKTRPDDSLPYRYA